MFRWAAVFAIFAIAPCAHALADMSWYDNCVELDKREQSALTFQTKNFNDQMDVCVDGCNPKCSSGQANTDCHCLKCMMWCLNQGTYTANCSESNPSVITRCLKTRRNLTETNSKTCDAICNGAGGRDGSQTTLLAVLTLASALYWLAVSG
eukprot:TRINITY_DN37984_c0_g1_i1.p1 TRINITY_DN37984_c0_g1~~TRINITY_DN37984_c0_g1_i1.p1  ORF type:complete len:151 (-),score=19.35 TRINITY_DN37984_c0_g1_i1:414-866(-)